MVRRTGSLWLITRIAGCDFRMTWKDKSVIIWIILMPVAFMFVFGQMNRGGSYSTPKATLTVDNHDTGPVSAGLIESLRRENFHIVDADSLAPDEKAVRTLVIPEGFSKKVFSRERVELVLRKDKGSNMQAGEAVSVAIVRGLIKTVSSLIEVESEMIGGKNGFIDIRGDTLYGNLQFVIENIEGSEVSIAAGIDSIVARNPIVTVKPETASRLREIPSGFQGSVPGNLVMFVLMGMVFSGAAITEERNSGVLRRMGMTIAGKREVVIGKLMGRMMVGGIQILVLLVIGRFFFHISIGRDIPALILLMFAFAFCCGSISILFGALFRNPDHMTGVAVTVTLAMSALGGCWWPLEVVSKPFKVVAFLLPTGWAIDGIHRLISFGYGLASVTGHITVLILFGIIFITIASAKLRWDR